MYGMYSVLNVESSHLEKGMNLCLPPLFTVTSSRWSTFTR